MIGLITAFILAMALSILGTPVLIRFLITHQYGQFIRQDGPTQHLTKRGTPTMGGLVIIVATIVAWLVGSAMSGAGPSWSGLCLLVLFAGLGLIGLLDDGIKIMRQRSLGLHPGGKIIGQIAVAVLFAWMSLSRPNVHGITPGSMAISFARPSALTLAFAGTAVGVVLYFIWTNFIVAKIHRSPYDAKEKQRCHSCSGCKHGLTVPLAFCCLSKPGVQRQGGPGRDQRAGAVEVPHREKGGHQGDEGEGEDGGREGRGGDRRGALVARPALIAPEADARPRRERPRQDRDDHVLQAV